MPGEELGAAPDVAPVAPRLRPFTLPRWWRGLLAVVSVVLLGLASLSTALAHGSQLGSYDIAATYGLTEVPGTVARNVIASDQVLQTAPWEALDWTEVHDGHLPLWNPYSAMGTPLLFNFQSAGLSLPALVSYGFPRRFAYDVLVFMKLIIAATGLLFVSRVLRLGWLSSVLAASVGELSGSFSAWLGWPMDGVMCWTGWVLGAGLLLAEGRRRRVAVPLLAGSLAFAVYGGHPESVVLLAIAVTIPVAVVLTLAARREGIRTAARRLLSLAAGAAAGVALSAPLWLPGAQALSGAVDQSRTGYVAFPLRSAAGLIFSGYFGYPLTTSRYFGPGGSYYESAAFVGLVGLVLAATAVLCRWRQPAIAGVALTAAVLGAIVWCEPVAAAINHLPSGKVVVWTRALIPLDLLLAVLAGVGFEILRKHWRSRSVARRLAISAFAAVGLLAALGLDDVVSPPAGVAGHIRAVSFLWPAIEAGVLLAVATVVLLASRGGRLLRRRWAAESVARVAVLALAASEVAFLLLGTPNLWSSSATGFAVTPAAAQLQALVGNERVGFDCSGATHFADLGILPETNVAYGVAEAEMYDPVLPLSYLRNYALLSHTRPAAPNGSFFCARVTSASLGRDYGIEYVLRPSGAPALPGTVADGTIGGEEVWRVPGASVVSLQPEGAPLDDESARPITFSDRDPGSLVLHLDATGPSRLELHIGSFPGWSASIDGQPLPLRPLFGDELQAIVPSGLHTVVVSYRPGGFVEGLYAAAAALVALAFGALLTTHRRRSTMAGLPPAPAMG